MVDIELTRVAALLLDRALVRTTRVEIARLLIVGFSAGEAHFGEPLGNESRTAGVFAMAGEYPRKRSGEWSARDVGRLLLRCADRPRLVAVVSTFLAGGGSNMVSLDQHSTQQSDGTFMQRTIFHLPGLTAARNGLEREFQEQVATPFEMDFRLTEAAKPKRVAIMASTEDHCILDLLWRNRRGDLDMSVVMVIANHAPPGRPIPAVRCDIHHSFLPAFSAPRAR